MGGRAVRVRIGFTLFFAAGLVPAFAAVAGGASMTPTTVQGNPTCADLGMTQITKFDPPADGTQNGVALEVDDQGMTVLSWSSETPVGAVIVKGGPRANVYFYDPAATGDSTLIAPINKGGQQAAISHVEFCAGEEPPEPEGVDVRVALGACDFVDGSSVTPLTVKITGDGEAKVEVKDATDTVIATFFSSDSVDLAPGEYTFQTTALNDSVLSEGSDTDGTVTALDCTPVVEALGSVAVSTGVCAFGAGASLTPVTVTIAPSGAATVNLSGPVAGTFTGTGGSADVTPGSYSWTATPADDFELTGATSGTFTAASCAAVLGTRLPRTGARAALLVLGLMFVAGGAAMMAASRRPWAEARER